MNEIIEVTCSCCEHSYSYEEAREAEYDEQYGMCGICYWLHDENVSDDDSVSERNGLSVTKYRKLLSKYADVKWLSDGLRAVNTWNQDQLPLAFHSDDYDIRGKWGYVDITGKEVIKPQYIYATGFSKGAAVVCKGDWIKSKKWDNEHNQGYYWTEEESWGVIDKSGNEIINCDFDEIYDLHQREEDPLYVVHKGGWHDKNKNYTGVCALIDNTGTIVVDFHYGDFGYGTEGGQVIVYADSYKWSDNPKIGVYDLTNMTEVITPKYASLEIVSRNVFLKSDDAENGFNSILINDKEEVLSDIKFLNVTQDYDDKSLYTGLLMDRETEFKFKIEKNQLVKSG